MTASRKTCGAATRATDHHPCGRPPLYGQRRCRFHGGASPQALHAAERREAEAKAAVLVAGLDWQPCDNPIEALSLLVGEVTTWKTVLADQVRVLTTLSSRDSFGVERIKPVIEAYERAQDRAGRLLTQVARLDLDSRLVAITEQQARVVVQAVEQTLRELGLDHEQQERGRMLTSKFLQAGESSR